jgi:sugar lactone lactonase YvrE
MPTTAARVFQAPPREEYGYLPEGPRRLLISGRPWLVWVNIQDGPNATTGSVHGRSLGRPDLTFALPCPARPGFLLPVAGGDRALVGLDQELRVLDLSTGRWGEPLVRLPDAHPRTIINDAEVVPGGRAVVFGTKDTRFQDPVAALYLYTVDDNRVSVLAERQLCSNGKVIRRDNGSWLLFDIDTPTRRVVRYRLDVVARTATPEGVAVDTSAQTGLPDGMCDCGDGSVIVAFYNPGYAEAGRAVRFDLATGQPLDEWTTPGSPRVTCPLLVEGEGGVELLLTTATEGMPPDLRVRCPNAGSLFLAPTGLGTCPEPEAVRLPG